MATISRSQVSLGLHLETHGLGARDHALEIPRLALVRGPSRSGKSELLHAIRLAALGYVPSLGRRPADTARLMREGALRVSLTLPDGRIVERGLERGPRGALVGRTEASWVSPEASQAEHHAAILAAFGGGTDEDSVARALDIRQLLAATPSERARVLERLLASSRTAEAVVEEIEELVTRRALGKEAVAYDGEAGWRILRPVLAAEQPGLHAELRRLAPLLVAHVREGGIAAALAWANGEKRTTTSEIKARSAARTELERRLEELPPATDSARIAELRERLAAAQRDEGAARERREAAERLARQIERLEQQIADIRIRMVQAREGLARADSLPTRSEELAKLRQELEALPEIPSPDLSAVDRLLQSAEKLRQQANAIVAPETRSLEAERLAVQHASEALERATKTAWPRVLELAHEIDGSPEIPAQAGIRRQIRELVDLATREAGGCDLAALRATLEESLARFAKVQKDTEASRRLIEEKLSMEEEARRLCAQADSQRRLLLEEHARATQSAVDRRRNLQQQIRELEQAEERRRIAREKAASALGRAEAEQAVLQRQRDSLGQMPDLGGLQQQIAEIKARAEAMAGELEAAMRGKAAREELERLTTEIVAAEARRDAFTVLEWACQRVREREIARAQGGPLRETMDLFLASAGWKERPFFRTGKGVCDLGWTDESGCEVSVEAFSGAEYALYCAALTCGTYAARGPCAEGEVRVLLVEAGEADTPTLEAILRGIRGAARQAELTAAVVCVQTRVDETAPQIEDWILVPC